MKQPTFYRLTGYLIFTGILNLATGAWCADKPPIEPVPGQTAITSPTPQPPQPESSIATEPSPIPGELQRDKNGAPILMVEFRIDHYDIPPAFKPQVKAFGLYLKQHPEATAELTGHADNSGHSPANHTLSQKRADTVFAYLVGHYGISSDRIKAEGYGEITDKSDNSTAAAKQADRRVYGMIKNPKAS